MSLTERIKGFILRRESSLPERPAGRGTIEPFKITLQAKSSGRGTYQVTFTCQDNRLWLKCTCIAGKFSQFCKHKFQLLSGNEDWLYDPQQKEDLAKILAILPLTNFPLLLDQYHQASNEAGLKEAKIQLKMAMRLGA